LGRFVLDWLGTIRHSYNTQAGSVYFDNQRLVTPCSQLVTYQKTAVVLYANLPQTRGQVVELRRQRFIQLYTNYYVFYNITILVQRIGCQVTGTAYVHLYYPRQRQTQLVTGIYKSIYKSNNI